MDDLLNDFNRSVDDIQASAVFSVDGVMIASTLAYDESPDEVGAIVAAMQSLGGKSAHLLRRGELKEIHIRGLKGDVIVSALGTDKLLLTLTKSHVNIGLLMFEIQRLQQTVTEQGAL